MAKLLAISGSLRRNSYNTSLIRAWKALAPEGTSVDILSTEDLRAVPLFDQDVEKGAFPEHITAIKDRIRAADGVIVSTPEYSRSIPGVLKNFLDWTARPYADSAWKGKPVFVVGATSGHVGTAVAQAAVRAILVTIGAFVLGNPEFYLSGADTKFDAEGNLVDESTKEHILKGYAAFLPFVEKVK